MKKAVQANMISVAIGPTTQPSVSDNMNDCTDCSLCRPIVNKGASSAPNGTCKHCFTHINILIVCPMLTRPKKVFRVQL